MINAIADVSTEGSWGIMRNQQINCDDGDFDLENSRELKTHNGNYAWHKKPEWDSQRTEDFKCPLCE